MARQKILKRMTFSLQKISRMPSKSKIFFYAELKDVSYIPIAKAKGFTTQWIKFYQTGI